jgi:anti-sigma regulatory factor (Ser/Thr protein kinase)
MQWLSDIRLPAVPSGVQRARHAVEVLPSDLPCDLRDDLRLLVSELTTNAIRHGGGAAASTAPDATIRLRMGLDDDVIRVEVHDRGPGFEPAPRGPESDLGSGWGVHFVRTLTDRWGAGHDEAGAWIVWFEMRLRDPGPAGPTMTYGQRAVEGGPLRSPAPARGADRAHRPGDHRDDYATAG